MDSENQKDHLVLTQPLNSTGRFRVNPSEFKPISCIHSIGLHSPFTEYEAHKIAENFARTNDSEAVVVQVKGACLFEKRTQLVAIDGTFAKGEE